MDVPCYLSYLLYPFCCHPPPAENTCRPCYKCSGRKTHEARLETVLWAWIAGDEWTRLSSWAEGQAGKHRASAVRGSALVDAERLSREKLFLETLRRRALFKDSQILGALLHHEPSAQSYRMPVIFVMCFWPSARRPWLRGVFLE